MFIWGFGGCREFLIGDGDLDLDLYMVVGLGFGFGTWFWLWLLALALIYAQQSQENMLSLGKFRLRSGQPGLTDVMDWPTRFG